MVAFFVDSWVCEHLDQQTVQDFYKYILVLCCFVLYALSGKPVSAYFLGKEVCNIDAGSEVD